jgi:putative transposase
MIGKNSSVSLARQCQILEISRSSLYYKPAAVNETDLRLMKLIDGIHLNHPYFGTRRICEKLCDMGEKVGRKHVRKLMNKMCITAIYNKPRLSKRNQTHKVYPYLLRGMSITKANQVWAADITYIPMAKGFCYLVAVMDWVSRKILSWRLSNTQDAGFCVDTLNEAIGRFGTPEVFNTDQGSQFTSDSFVEALASRGIKISMDGKGSWKDNVFIERFWKTVKYEEVYLKGYESLTEARKELKGYLEFYNQERRHQGLDSRTPDEVYWSTVPKVQVAA